MVVSDEADELSLKFCSMGQLKLRPLPLPNTIQVYFINCQKWVVVGGGARGKGLKGAVKGVE